jgi:hypothetical protein
LTLATGTFTSEDVPPENGYVPPRQEPKDETPDYDAIFSADAADFIKRPVTQKAREYTKKTQAALNTYMQACLQDVKTLPDAAAIIAHGQNFAMATGTLADADEKAAKMIDIIMSPENPYFAFAIAGIPLVAQLFRNHQAQVEDVVQSRRGRTKMTKEERKAYREAKQANTPKLDIVIPILKKHISVRVPVKQFGTFGKNFMTSRSVDPQSLTSAVFNNEDVIKALHKRGLKIGKP